MSGTAMLVSDGDDDHDTGGDAVDQQVRERTYEDLLSVVSADDGPALRSARDVLKLARHSALEASG
jgi:hypothetical protein